MQLVRDDPMAYNETGDEWAQQPGRKPWIAEMYGYSFGAAVAGVWHRVDLMAQLYPGYTAYGGCLCVCMGAWYPPMGRGTYGGCMGHVLCFVYERVRWWEGQEGRWHEGTGGVQPLPSRPVASAWVSEQAAPAAAAADKPVILHYGRLWEVGPSWQFQKHWFFHFRALQVWCRRRAVGLSWPGCTAGGCRPALRVFRVEQITAACLPARLATVPAVAPHEQAAGRQGRLGRHRRRPVSAPAPPL